MTLALAEVGDHERAERHRRDLASEGLDAFPRDQVWLVLMALLAEAPVRVGSAVLAEQLLDLLHPSSGRFAQEAALMLDGDSFAGRLHDPWWRRSITMVGRDGFEPP